MPGQLLWGALSAQSLFAQPSLPLLHISPPSAGLEEAQAQADKMFNAALDAFDQRDAALAQIAALEASNKAMRDALVMARDTLMSSRIFVTSRQRVKAPEGEELFDETIETVVGILATTVQYGDASRAASSPPRTEGE